MKAAVLTEVGKVEIKDTEIPQPGPDEVLIRVRLAGICGSDHTLYHGRFGVPLPVIPGHEAIGTVEALGTDVTAIDIGQRVTIQPNFACGTCPLCASGHGNLCRSKIRLGVDADGAFAQFVKAPARYVWPIPESIADEVAVFTEPLSVCVHAMSISAPEKKSKVLIFGAGIMGLLILQLARLTGAEVVACDLAEERLDLARQLGVTSILGPGSSLDAHKDAFDLIYETSGAPPALNQVMQLAAPKGKIVVLSLPGKEHAISIDQLVRKELQILGSLIYVDEFPKALEILKHSRIRTAPLTTGRISLADLNQFLGEFSSPGRVKTLVEI